MFHTFCQTFDCHTQYGFVADFVSNHEVGEEDFVVDEEDIDVLRLGAVEQAKMLIEVMKERDSIKRDAEDFAKTILEKQKERRQIIKAAEEGI